MVPHHFVNVLSTPASIGSNTIHEVKEDTGWWQNAQTGDVSVILIFLNRTWVALSATMWCDWVTLDLLGIWLSITQITFHFLLLHFILLLKTFPLFLGNRICLKTVLQLFMNLHIILGIVYVKLATNRKLCRVSTYLPNPEVLCLECVWNTIWPPQSLALDWGLWVARNTFLWVLSTHRNFTKDLGMLRKSLWTV